MLLGFNVFSRRDVPEDVCTEVYSRVEGCVQTFSRVSGVCFWRLIDLYIGTTWGGLSFVPKSSSADEVEDELYRKNIFTLLLIVTFWFHDSLWRVNVNT